jgi:hypothetical protein
MATKAVKVKGRRPKSGRATEQTPNVSKKRIKPANTYTEGRPELPPRNPAPRK